MTNYEHKILICTCAKCGSTSLFNFLYKVNFGKDWPYNDFPWISMLTEGRWKGRLRHCFKTKGHYCDWKNPNVWKMALIRDPKERLISSWRSKIACGATYGQDDGDRADRKTFVPKLAKYVAQLGGNLGPAQEDCLTFDQFIKALSVIHNASEQRFLNQHYMPQAGGKHDCFSVIGPEKYDAVVTANGIDESLAADIAKRFGVKKSKHVSFPHAHASTNVSTKFYLDPEVDRLFSLVVEKELHILRKYLQS